MLNDAERRQAETIQRRHLAEVAGIRGNGDLSADGKRRMIARSTLTARGAMAQLRAAADARDGQRRSDLQYRLFGMGSKDSSGDVLAARDARDRAAQIKSPGEAARMLAHAERAGDTSLARAVFELCWDRIPTDIGSGWSEVGAGYLTTRPEARTLATELAGLTMPDAQTRMREQLAVRVTTPDEVRTGSLEALAAERDDAA